MSDYETLKSRVDTDDGTYWWALLEIERLREALEKITKTPPFGQPQMVARAALEEGKMSNDLVKRLRAGVNLYYGTGPSGLLNEAANRIEALEKALRFYGDKHHWRKQHDFKLNKDFWTFANPDDGGMVARAALEGTDEQ
jgi:hypothetical protein